MGPKSHRFEYSVFMLCIELSELPDLFKPFICWSAQRPALAWFRRKDHMGDAARPLSDSVRDLVERRTGDRPLGPIPFADPSSLFWLLYESGQFLLLFRLPR
ncbi:MAG: hypothetical protein CM1200mP41_38400 [Gammaproteobacteria bacterium]|nr:MAG: hypothetical protein CM1200mP41_38400 [Gammaproteobacteria bacterium]